MTPSRVLLLLTIAALAACGNGGAGAPREPSPGAGATGPAAAAEDTATVAPDTTASAAAIPADFPSDFPLPPDHVVLEATSASDVAGRFSRARLAVEAPDAETPFAWYRQALVDAGWQIAAEGTTNGSRTMHAIQGESYVDLVVGPDAARPGRVVIEASIWKVEAL